MLAAKALIGCFCIVPWPKGGRHGTMAPAPSTLLIAPDFNFFLTYKNSKARVAFYCTKRNLTII